MYLVFISVSLLFTLSIHSVNASALSLFLPRDFNDDRKAGRSGTLSSFPAHCRRRPMVASDEQYTKLRPASRFRLLYSSSRDRTSAPSCFFAAVERLLVRENSFRSKGNGETSGDVSVGTEALWSRKRKRKERNNKREKLGVFAIHGNIISFRPGLKTVRAEL